MRLVSPLPSRRTWLALATLTVAVAAGCSTSAPASQVTTSPRSPTGSVSPSTTSPDSDSVGFTSTESVPLPGQRDVNQVALFGQYLAWDSCTACGDADPPDELYVDNLETHKTELVARAPKGGELSWQVGTGDYVVWTELSAQPTDESPNTVWTMWAQDLVTGVRWVVDSSHGLPAGSGPLPEAAEGRVVWIQPDSDGRTSDIVLQDLATRQRSVLVRQVLPFSAHISGDSVVYDDSYPPHQPGANLRTPPQAREVFSVPLSGGQAIDLGGDHSAHSPDAANGWATWGEPEYGDQRSIWAAPADGGSAPHLVYRGLNVQQVTGAGYLVFWTESNGLYVTSMQGGAKVVDVNQPAEPTYVPAHFSADGTNLAYATVQGLSHADELITIHVLRIRVT